MIKHTLLVTCLFMTINAKSQNYMDVYNNDSKLRYSYLNFREKIALLKDVLCEEDLDEIEQDDRESALYRQISVHSEGVRIYYGMLENKSMEELQNIDFNSINFDQETTPNIYLYNYYEDSFDVFGWVNYIGRGSCNGIKLYTSYSQWDDKYNIQTILSYIRDKGWDKHRLYILKLLYNPACVFFYYEDLYVSYLGEIMFAREFFNNVRYSNEFQDFLKSAEDFK